MPSKFWGTQFREVRNLSGAALVTIALLLPPVDVPSPRTYLSGGKETSLARGGERRGRQLLQELAGGTSVRGDDDAIEQISDYSREPWPGAAGAAVRQDCGHYLAGESGGGWRGRQSSQLGPPPVGKPT